MVADSTLSLITHILTHLTQNNRNAVMTRIQLTVKLLTSDYLKLYAKIIRIAPTIKKQSSEIITEPVTVHLFTLGLIKLISRIYVLLLSFISDFPRERVVIWDVPERSERKGWRLLKSLHFIYQVILWALGRLMDGKEALLPRSASGIVPAAERWVLNIILQVWDLKCIKNV